MFNFHGTSGVRQKEGGETVIDDSTWFRKLTVGPFTEPGILLQIASIRTNTSGHCLNCYVSRPVFTYYSVIMCNCHEVSIDILVVTPAY